MDLLHIVHKPTFHRCLACTRLNLECLQSDVFSVVPADKAPSRRKRVTPQAAPTQHSPSVDTTEPGGPVTLDDKTCQQEASCHTLSELPSIYRLKEFQFDISQPECWLFQYYIEKLSGLLVNAVGYENPLQSLIVPRVLSSPLLLRTVCSVSALHRSSCAEGDEANKYQTEATRYYVWALSDLREHVPLLYGKSNTGLLQTVLLSSIFLCKYEIIKDGVTNWRRHLKGIESLCQLLGDRDSFGPMTDIMEFARSLYVTEHLSIMSSNR